MADTKLPELIVALDMEEKDLALAMVGELGEAVNFYKIGSRLFTACGPDIVKEIKGAGKRVFLDLKFHDIPATVAGSVRAAVRIGVDMLTIHTSGGLEMMKMAVEASSEEAEKLAIRRPTLIGVTILTSLTSSELSRIFGYSGEVESLVLKLAEMAKDAGLDGVVSSVWEAEAIRRAVGERFVIVTPGIRPQDSVIADQKRVATPRDALLAGSDFIVVGRPITKSPSPKEEAVAILEELKKGALE